MEEFKLTFKEKIKNTINRTNNKIIFYETNFIIILIMLGFNLPQYLLLGYCSFLVLMIFVFRTKNIHY